MASCLIGKTSSRTNSRYGSRPVSVSASPLPADKPSLSPQERKYFDSGDYALSKAGKTSEISPTDVGREHPVPENIPHLSTSPSAGSGPHERGSISGPIGGIGLNTAVTGGPTLAPPGVHGAVQSGSPVKEGSWLQREQSVDDQDNGGLGEKEGDGKGVPIRGAGEKS